MAKWTRLTLAVLFVCSLPACVYYNTFYNARKKFDDATDQRLQSGADPSNKNLANAYLDYYNAAIKKASLVLQLHPDSKWVDDSLLMIGKCYYWRGEHKDALLKFDELLDNFPESDLRTESQYWKAIALWGNDDISESRELLGGVSESGDKTFAWQSRLALAELEQSQENYDLAIKNYLSLVDGLEDKELQTRLWKGLGDTYFTQGSHANALNAYKKVLLSHPDDVTSYQTQLQIGSTHELTADLDAALATYKRLEKTKRFKRYQPKVQLRIANVYLLTGDIDAALEVYQDVIKQNPRTEASAEAYYGIAMIEHQIRRNNEAALELFAKARKERSTSEAAVKAREMEKTLFQLDKFKKRSEKETKQGTEALFSVAEIYLFSLGEVDSALSAYREVLTRSDSSGAAPKALYGMGLIYADSLQNQEEATRIFKQLVDDYPVTPYAVDARRRIGLDRSDDILAEARYVEAEALKAEGADPHDVVTILQQVTDEYPNSLYAPKALFALGWAYENDLGDLETASEHYTRLAEKYPMTDYAEISGDKVKHIAKELRTRKREQDRQAKEAAEAAEDEASDKGAEPDSSTKTETASLDSEDTEESSDAKPAKGPEPADGSNPSSTEQAAQPSQPDDSEPMSTPADGPLEAGQIDQLPTLIRAPPPEPREELEEEGVSPTVTVRILVNKNGRVKRVIVVNGAEVLEEAAVDAAFEFLFEPGKHQGKPREVWMEFPITFTGPAGGGEEEPQ